MNEILLSVPGDVGHYPKELNAAPVIVDLGGREYTKYSLAFPIKPLTRVVKLIQALAATLLTGLIVLLNSDFRRFFKEQIKGKEQIVILAPVIKEEPKIDQSPTPVLNGTTPNALTPPHTPSNGLTPPHDSRANSAKDALALLNGSDDESSEASETSSDEEDSSSSDSVEMGGLGLSISSLLNFDEIPLKTLFKDTHEYIISQQGVQGQEALIKEKVVACVSACLKEFRKAQEWKIIKNEFAAFKENNNLEKLDIVTLFYNAVSIYKDYKISNPGDVVDKIFSPIELDKATQKSSPVKSTTNASKEFLVKNYSVAVQRAQGKRPTMEDKDAAGLMHVGSSKIPYFAVFDGHAGTTCSKFLKDNLIHFLQEELGQIDLSDPIAVNTALKLGFVKVNTAFVQKGEESGSTAIVAFILNDSLWVANTGDSRAVANIGEEAFQLSKDHKATDERFQKGVKSRGGMILLNRVNGSLAVARTFGDTKVGTGISARPTIKCTDISNLDKSLSNQLIIGCDGLFDVVGSEEAASLVNGKTAKSAAKTLLNEALNRGTQDNVTVMVIDLNN